MITEVNAVNFRQNLGDMLNQVQYRNDSIVINKDGKIVFVDPKVNPVTHAAELRTVLQQLVE